MTAPHLVVHDNAVALIRAQADLLAVQEEFDFAGRLHLVAYRIDRRDMARARRFFARLEEDASTPATISACFETRSAFEAITAAFTFPKETPQ